MVYIMGCLFGTIPLPLLLCNYSHKSPLPNVVLLFSVLDHEPLNTNLPLFKTSCDQVILFSTELNKGSLNTLCTNKRMVDSYVILLTVRKQTGAWIINKETHD